jgi:hypothetical protein
VAGGGDSADPPEEAIEQVERYLYLKNTTGRNLTLYLQYRTKTEKGDWQWYPADPRESEEPLRFELKPGQETFLEDDGWTIRASRVRMWASADGGNSWNEYKDADLWLVPEVNGDGYHRYDAPQVEVYPVTVGR